MTKLFIHIGTWKTGSSTIQYNLYRLRKELEKEGFYYLCKKNKMVINDGVIRNFTDLEEDYILKSREKFKTILDRELAKNRSIDFISSAEEFSGSPFKGFKNAGAVARNLHEITKGFGLDISIIVYLRRQDDFFESLYQQSIRLGESHQFDDFLSSFDESDFNWHSVLKGYADIFGKDKVVVRRYHDKFLPHENSLIQDFGQIIGSKIVSNFELTTSRNTGYSRDTLEITRIMNQYFEDDDRYELRKIYDKITSRIPFQKYAFFTPSGRKEFLSRYSESNKKVLEEFLNTEDQNLFPEPEYEEKASHYDGLTNEAIVINFSNALLTVKRSLDKQHKNRLEDFQNKFIRFRIKNKIRLFLNKFPRLKSILKRL